jgi:hypothetical protein
MDLSVSRVTGHQAQRVDVDVPLALGLGLGFTL